MFVLFVLFVLFFRRSIIRVFSFVPFVLFVAFFRCSNYSPSYPARGD